MVLAIYWNPEVQENWLKNSPYFLELKDYGENQIVDLSKDAIEKNYFELRVPLNAEILCYACRHSPEFLILQRVLRDKIIDLKNIDSISEFLDSCKNEHILDLGYREIAWQYYK